MATIGHAVFDSSWWQFFLFFHVYGNVAVFVYSSLFGLVSIKNSLIWYVVDLSLFIVFYWTFFW